MSVTVIEGIRLQCVEALQQVRRHQHKAGCDCRAFQGYCTPEHKFWSQMLDKLIDQSV